MKSIALIALLVLSACEGYTSTGQWKSGIPSTSGYYVDPVRKCIHVGQVNNGLTKYHSTELVNRVANGEKMCPESAGHYKGASLIVIGIKSLL